MIYIFFFKQPRCTVSLLALWSVCSRAPTSPAAHCPLLTLLLLYPHHLFSLCVAQQLYFCPSPFSVAFPSNSRNCF